MTRPYPPLLLLLCLGCSSSHTQRASGQEHPVTGGSGGEPAATGGEPATGGATGGEAGVSRGGNGAGGSAVSTGGEPPAVGGSSAAAGSAGQALGGASGEAGEAGHGAGGAEAGSGGEAGSPPTNTCTSPGLRECHEGAPRECSAEGEWVEQPPCDTNTSYCWAGHCSSPFVRMADVRGISYAIDRTEVTQQQYAAWLATAPFNPEMPIGCEYVTSFENLLPDPTCMALPEACEGAGCERHPQVCVDWCSAAAYCTAVGKHLCGKIGGGKSDQLYDASYDQWYNACSSGGVNIYPYGGAYQAELCNDAELWEWTGAPLPGTVAAAAAITCQSSVAGYEGVFDLSGNVWEWENSCQTYAGADDPCVMRGGWYQNYAAGGNLRCDRAYVSARGTAAPHIGFRCCTHL